MRLGILTTSYPRSRTDLAGCFVAELARELACAGHGVEVLAAAPARASIDDARCGVRVDGLRYALSPRLFYGAGAPDNLLAGAPLDRLRALLQAPAFTVRLAAAAAGRVRMQRWDAMISHWLVPCGVVGASVAPSLPQLVIAHGSDAHLLAALPGASFALETLASAHAARLVLTSESLRAPLAARARSARARTFVGAAAVERMGVAPPAPSHLAAPPGAARRLRARHGIADDRAVVLFVGRLIGLKGVDVLIEASASAPSRWTLVVVGDGPERSRLEALARCRGVDARFVGVATGALKQQWFAAANLLALPSRLLPDGRSDSSPVVLLEALAAGLPVVATDVGGNAELFAAGPPISARLVAATGAGGVAPAAALRSALLAQLATPRDPAASRALAAPHHWPAVAARLAAMLASQARVASCS